MILKEININYSVLQYVPDPIRQESINVGIVFHVPETSTSFFFNSKNKNRIKSFDDEFDLEFYNAMIDSIHFEFDYPINQSTNEYYEDFGDERFNEINNYNFLNDKISTYVNEFKFLKVENLPSDSNKMEKDIEALRKTYLYYDHPKTERISKKEVKSLLSRQFRVIRLKGVKKDNVYNDIFSSGYTYDYILQDRIIKVLSFDAEKLGTLSTTLKKTLFDLQTTLNENNNARIQFVINDNFEETNINIYNTFKKHIEKISNEFTNSKVKITTVRNFSNF